MDVLFCFDQNYEQHFGVAVTSLLLHNPEQVQTVHIITERPSFKLKQQLSQLSAQYHVAIEIHEIESQQLEALKINDHFTPAIYYRLMAANVLPPTLSKVLYLDADLVVTGAIDELYQTDVSGYSVAACGSKVVTTKQRLNLQGDYYFNSGVMLINLEEWRRNDTGMKAIALVRDQPQRIKYADQDALNILIDGNFYQLDHKWNTLVDLDQRKYPTAESVIIHFVGSLKPWHSWCINEHKHIYWTYLKRSLWAKSRPTLPKDLRQVAAAARYIWRQVRANPSV
jgi:lipopolysaccharide biosynthesis glycosyltransferase